MMWTKRALWRLFLGAALLALPLIGIQAEPEKKEQDKSEASSKAKKAEGAKGKSDKKQADKELPTVITNDYLKKRFPKSGTQEEATPKMEVSGADASSAAAEEAQPAAITNEALQKRLADSEGAGTASGETPVFTNEDLPESPAEDSAQTAEQPGSAAAGPMPEADAPQPKAQDPAQRIAEIDVRIERMKKRIKALQNPLLAGGSPPLDEEKEDWKGLGADQRIKRIEAQIAKLEAERATLQP